MKSCTDDMMAEFLIVSFDTYLGLSVIIRSVVACVLSSFVQGVFDRFAAQTELAYVKIGLT